MTQPTKLTLAALSPPPLVLEIQPGLVVTIPAPGVRTVAEIYQIEKAISDAAASEEENVEALMDAQINASNYIVALLRKHEPKVPDDLELSLGAIIALIRAIVEGPTAAAAIQEALTGSGLVDAEARERQRREQTDLDEDGEPKAKGKQRAPLASKKRSSRPSSTSESATTGSPNGGTTARGQRSRPTSRTRSAG